jgi:GTP-binding protein
MFLVDLPGYGYARGGGRAADEFGRLTEAYFARGTGGRHGVRIGVLLLVDARHPGLESDLKAWAWLREQPSPAGVIGTKVDKLTRAERERHARELESLFAIPVLLVSAETGEGLEELWTLIAKLPNRTAA